MPPKGVGFTDPLWGTIKNKYAKAVLFDRQDKAILPLMALQGFHA